MVEEFNPDDCQNTNYEKYKQDMVKFSMKINTYKSGQMVEKTPDQFTFEEQQEYIKNEYQRQLLVSTQINLQNIQKKIQMMENKRSKKQETVFMQEQKQINNVKNSQLSLVKTKSLVSEVMKIDICDLIEEDKQANNIKIILQQQVRQVAQKFDGECQCDQTNTEETNQQRFQRESQELQTIVDQVQAEVEEVVAANKDRRQLNMFLKMKILATDKKQFESEVQAKIVLKDQSIRIKCDNKKLNDHRALAQQNMIKDRFQKMRINPEVKQETVQSILKRQNEALVDQCYQIYLSMIKNIQNLKHFQEYEMHKMTNLVLRSKIQTLIMKYQIYEKARYFQEFVQFHNSQIQYQQQEELSETIFQNKTETETQFEINDQDFDVYDTPVKLTRKTKKLNTLTEIKEYKKEPEIETLSSKFSIAAFQAKLKLEKEQNTVLKIKSLKEYDLKDPQQMKKHEKQVLSKFDNIFKFKRDEPAPSLLQSGFQSGIDLIFQESVRQVSRFSVNQENQQSFQNKFTQLKKLGSSVRELNHNRLRQQRQSSNRDFNQQKFQQVSFESNIQMHDVPIQYIDNDLEMVSYFQGKISKQQTGNQKSFYL